MTVPPKVRVARRPCVGEPFTYLVFDEPWEVVEVGFHEETEDAAGRGWLGCDLCDWHVKGSAWWRSAPEEHRYMSVVVGLQMAHARSHQPAPVEAIGL